jgi:hypothetical protein
MTPFRRSGKLASRIPPGVLGPFLGPPGRLPLAVELLFPSALGVLPMGPPLSSDPPRSSGPLAVLTAQPRAVLLRGASSPQRPGLHPPAAVPAVRQAGLEPLRFHDLRHTAAALAIKAGAHPRAIMERLGHSSITTTLNQYGHLFPELDQALAGRLDEMAQSAFEAGPIRDQGGTAASRSAS